MGSTEGIGRQVPSTGSKTYRTGQDVGQIEVHAQTRIIAVVNSKKHRKITVILRCFAPGAKYYCRAGLLGV